MKHRYARDDNRFWAINYLLLNLARSWRTGRLEKDNYLSMGIYISEKPDSETDTHHEIKLLKAIIRECEAHLVSARKSAIWQKKHKKNA